RLRPEELPLVRAMGFPADDPPAHGLRGRLAPWYEYRYLIVDRYAPFLLTGGKLNAGHEPNARGFVRNAPVAPADARTLLALTQRQYADYMPGFRPDGCGVSAVRDTLGQCRAAGWRAALVLMPEPPVAAVGARRRGVVRRRVPRPDRRGVADNDRLRPATARPGVRPAGRRPEGPHRREPGPAGGRDDRQLADLDGAAPRCVGGVP